MATWRLRGTAALLAAMIVLVGCGSAKPAPGTDSNAPKPASGTPVNGGTLTIAQGADALTLDPALTTDEASNPVEQLLFNGLVKFDPAMKVVSDLADKWEINNGTEYVFHLHPGVKFHDGSALKASDVKFSLDRMSDPNVKSRWASHFKDVKTVEAVDDNTVKVTLKQPSAAFLAAVASFVKVMKADFVTQHNGNVQRVEDGTGPFKLKDWAPNTAITLEKFPDYFESGKPYLDQVVFKVIPEPAARLAAVRDGAVHFTWFKEPQYGAQLEQMQKANQAQLFKVAANEYHMFGFNTKHKPLDNPKVREAIQWTVDRDALLKSAALGQGQVSGILSPALGQWVTPIDQFPTYKRDVNKAKALLAEAGYPQGISFRIMAPNNYPVDLNDAIALQQQLKEAGINVEIDKTEWGTYVKNWVDRNFDSFVGSNGNWTDPDIAMYAALHTGGSTNAFQYSDPDLDKLLEQGRTTTDDNARKQIYTEIQKRLVKDGPMVYTFAVYEYYTASPKLQGYTANVTGGFRNLAYSWLQK